MDAFELDAGELGVCELHGPNEIGLLDLDR